MLPPEVAVEVIFDDELDRHRTWIQNWLSLLPYLSATASVDLDSLSGSVVEFFAREASFDDAERHFVHLDPVLVRTAVIAGLHQGRLFSNDLLAKPWDRHTRTVRVSSQALNAPQ